MVNFKVNQELEYKVIHVEVFQIFCVEDFEVFHMDNFEAIFIKDGNYLLLFANDNGMVITMIIVYLSAKT